MSVSQRRFCLALLLSVLPWPAVWLGMYRLDSLWATFFLYHGVCLLPAVFWGRRLWSGAWRPPTRAQGLALLVGVLISLPVFVVGYRVIGSYALDTHSLLRVVTARGFTSGDLIPLALYFVPVNAALEELFWRGVVLNELHGVTGKAWTFGAVWATCAFAAWHWLVLRLLLRPGWAELAVAGIVAAGAFFSWLYRRTGSIVVPILWHGLVFDLALIIVFALALRG